MRAEPALATASGRRSLSCGAILLLMAALVLAPTPLSAQQPTDTVLMAALQRFKADTIYHVRINTLDSTLKIYLGQVPLVTCRFNLVDQDDAESYREEWRDNRKIGWEDVVRRKVWSGRPAVSDTVVEVVARVSKVDPDLISRVMPRRFVVDLTDEFVIRVMTVEGASEERSFHEKWIAFKQNWIPFQRQPHLDLVVTEKDAQTLYYALEPGTPIVLIDP